MDYEKLLDDWAEKLLSEADKFRETSEDAIVGSYNHGYSKGYSDGMYMALTFLNRIERKMKK